MTATSTAIPDHVEVVIVGAGLSGIGAAYRLQDECPDRSYLVLEAREAIGGTWDLFRYPGIRSDSDIFTLSYPFQPWTGELSIADGDAILDYIRQTAAQFGIDRRIRYATKVMAADWSSRTGRWTLALERTDPDGTVSHRTLTCSFLYCCTGYYDYDQGHAPDFPGAGSFAGTLVHPQFWPEDLDYAGKRVVVIGSGATAITLVPSLATRAAHVTMLQRTPTWISALPRRDALADKLRRRLPARSAHRLIRAKNIASSIAFYQYCRRFPQAARRLLTTAGIRRLKDEKMVREHFTPSYAPWDQRLCVAADADLFKAVRSGSAEVVTDHIEEFVPEGIRLRSGRILPADLVITATGLRLLAFGRVNLSVDGAPVEPAKHLVWRGAMLSDVPNFAICVGYTNASWTLRADLTSRLVCKILNHMTRRGLAAVAPKPGPEVRERPFLDLASGYVQRSIDDFPRQGDRGPWRVRQNIVLDTLATLRTDLDKTLTVTPKASPNRPVFD